MHVKALQGLLDGKNLANYEVFNLGTGKDTSVLEVIQSFEQVSGQRLNYKIVDRRPGDVIQAYVDTKKANGVLKWRVKYNLDKP